MGGRGPPLRLRKPARRVNSFATHPGTRVPTARSRPMQKSILLIALTAAVPALAQNAQPTNPNVPVGPPGAATAPPERIAPPDGTLSDRLSQQRGAIKPPSVDPGMTVAPSQAGAATTPVIPPPGSPGGNQSVVPK